jgi:putative salt-induced outer membrane protein YdiY
MRYGEDDDFIAGRLGFNFRYNLSRLIVFTDRLTYYPSLDHFGDYTLRNEAAITAPLGAQWALKLANIFQYDNEPSPGLCATDLQ